MEELSNKIDYNDLKYVTINNNTTHNFSDITDPIIFLNEIKKDKISL